jgi:hypothetical protein
VITLNMIANVTECGRIQGTKRCHSQNDTRWGGLKWCLIVSVPIILAATVPASPFSLSRRIHNPLMLTEVRTEESPDGMATASTTEFLGTSSFPGFDAAELVIK